MRLLDDLTAFMEIPSVTGEEGPLARHLCDRLASTGRPVVLDDRTAMIQSPADARPLVLLAGHIDTVPPRGNEKPRRDGETVWGRGAADMKAGLAVIAALLDRPTCGTGWARVGAILYAGEEGPFAGNDLPRILDGPAGWARGADLAILLEPTDAEIEVGCLGVINLEVVFAGRASHSARPWLGRNAIQAALPWLSKITGRAPIEHTFGSYIFRETASVTTFKAGTARNVIPGEAIANLNYRFPPGWTRDRARSEALALAAEADQVRLVDLAPSGDVPLEHPLYKTFLDGSGRSSRAKQAWTDVATFSERGIPALNFGPGDPQLAHSDDERVEIQSMMACLETLVSFLEGSRPFEKG